MGTVNILRRTCQLLAVLVLFFCKIFGVLQVLVYLPMSLDIRGPDCLKGFSLLLVLLFTSTSAAKWMLRRHGAQRVANVTSLIVLPSVPLMLIVSLNEFHSPRPLENLLRSEPSGISVASLLRYGGDLWGELLAAIGPFFVILEGICTLLCIQMVSRFSLSRLRRSHHQDIYQVFLLLATSVIYLASSYSMYLLYSASNLDQMSATLIGCTLTSVVFLSGIAFVGRRGTVLDTSLMMAYVCSQIYHMFSHQRTSTISFFVDLLRQPPSPDGPHVLPVHVLNSMHALFSALRNGMGVGYLFMIKSLSMIPFYGLIALFYRVFVLYMASCIIIGFRTGFTWPRLPRPQSQNVFFELLYTFNEPILIGSYVHLLLGFGPSLTFWRWINISITIALWCVELLIPSSDQ